MKLKLEQIMLKLEPLMLKLEPMMLKPEPMMLKPEPRSCMLRKLQEFTSKMPGAEPYGVRSEQASPNEQP